MKPLLLALFPGLVAPPAFATLQEVDAPHVQVSDLLGVNSDRDREVVEKIIEEKETSWRSFWNGGSTVGPISTAWNVSVWPTVYVIDHEGVIRYRSVRGETIRPEDLDEAIAELVAKAEGAQK